MRRTKALQEHFGDDGLDDDLDDDFEPADPFSEDDPSLDDQEDDDDEDGDDELFGLEVEELKMVERGVSAKVFTFEQAREVAGLLREELSQDPSDHAIRQNEFLCESCFLAKRVTQRASSRSKICIDCF